MQFLVSLLSKTVIFIAVLAMLPIALGAIILLLAWEYSSYLSNKLICKVYKHKFSVPCHRYAEYKELFEKTLKRRHYYIERMYTYNHFDECAMLTGYNFRVARAKDYTWMSLVL